LTPCAPCSIAHSSAAAKAIPFARLCVSCQEAEERGALA
jgi:RNA polymerase-binding transcription factor DksA